jgi:hypothetical protein
MAGDDRADIERLRDYWDGLVLGKSDTPGDLDPETIDIVNQLRDWYRPSLPDPSFHARMEEDLMLNAPMHLHIDDRSTGQLFALRPHQQPAMPYAFSMPRRWMSESSRLLSYVATVALVVVTLLAITLTAGPGRPGGEHVGKSTTLPALLAPSTPAAMTEELIIESTLFGLAYDVPTTPALIYLDEVQLLPGTSVSFPADSSDLNAYLVESGVLTMNMAEDVPVTRHGQLRGLVYGGEDTDLEPGDGFVKKPSIGGELRTEDTKPVVLRVIRIVPETPEEPASEPGL